MATTNLVATVGFFKIVQDEFFLRGVPTTEFVVTDAYGVVLSYQDEEGYDHVIPGKSTFNAACELASECAERRSGHPMPVDVLPTPVPVIYQDGAYDTDITSYDECQC